MVQSTITQKRISWIDNLKALAISLVVIGHVCNFGIGQYSICDQLHFLIYMFHMPLFFVISGVNYSIRKDRNSPLIFLDFVVPSIVFYGIAVILNPTWGGGDRYRMIWYLVVMLYIYICRYLLGNRKALIIIQAIFFMVFSLGQICLFYNFGENVMYKLVSEITMYFGYYICFHIGFLVSEKKRLDKCWIVFCSVLSCLFLFVQYYLPFQCCLIRILCGICIAIILVEIFKRSDKCNRITAWMSRYSLEIYLIHINLVHSEIIVNILFKYNSKIGLYFFVFFMDFFLPFCYVCLENRLKLLKFIMHPRYCIYTEK